MHHANVTDIPCMVLLTMILRKGLSRALQATKAFVYQEKSLIELYIFKACRTFEIIIRIGVLRISRVFRRIFTYL